MFSTTYVAIYALVAYMTFIFIARRYHRLRADGKLGRDWEPPAPFFFGLLMGVVWPLALGWLVATLPPRPSREERKLASKRRIAKLVAETERRASELGVGE